MLLLQTSTEMYLPTLPEAVEYQGQGGKGKVTVKTL